MKLKSWTRAFFICSLITLHPTRELVFSHSILTIVMNFHYLCWQISSDTKIVIKKGTPRRLTNNESVFISVAGLNALESKAIPGHLTLVRTGRTDQPIRYQDSSIDQDCPVKCERQTYFRSSLLSLSRCISRFLTGIQSSDEILVKNIGIKALSYPFVGPTLSP